MFYLFFFFYHRPRDACNKQNISIKKLYCLPFFFSFMRGYNYKKPIHRKEMVFVLCSMRFPTQKLENSLFRLSLDAVLTT